MSLSAGWGRGSPGWWWSDFQLPGVAAVASAPQEPRPDRRRPWLRKNRCPGGPQKAVRIENTRLILCADGSKAFRFIYAGCPPYTHRLHGCAAGSGDLRKFPQQSCGNRPRKRGCGKYELRHPLRFVGTQEPFAAQSDAVCFIIRQPFLRLRPPQAPSGMVLLQGFGLPFGSPGGSQVIRCARGQLGRQAEQFWCRVLSFFRIAGQKSSDPPRLRPSGTPGGAVLVPGFVFLLDRRAEVK